jgi:hypothetical protein
MCTVSLCAQDTFLLAFCSYEQPVFLEKYSTNTDLHTRINTHLYEHIYAHSILMSTSERLSRLDLEIHKVGHKERLTINGNITYHCKNN